MLDLWQKRKIRTVMYNPVTLILLFLLVIFIFHSTWVVYRKKQDSEALKQMAMARAEDLQTRDKLLQSKIDRLSTDSGLEEEIRSKFSVVKGDEKMVIVVENEPDFVGTTTSKTGFWQKIKIFFSF